VRIYSAVISLRKQKEDDDFQFFGNEPISIAIGKDLVNNLKKFSIADENKSEAGGVLFGYRYKDGIEITEFTTPMPSDIRRPYSFMRKDQQHISKAKYLWSESDYKCDYIGEWHTHPSGNAEPSYIDRREWIKLYESFRKPIVTIIQSPSNFQVYFVGK
jgi:integrative and conjugative element protein (TIGR02256 family)